MKHSVSKPQEKVLTELASGSIGQQITARQAVSARVLIGAGLLELLQYRGDACTCYVITPAGIQWLREHGHAGLADRYNPHARTSYEVRPAFDSRETIRFVVDARHAVQARQAIQYALGAGMKQYDRTRVSLVEESDDPLLSVEEVQALLEPKRDRRPVSHVSANCLPNDPVDVRCGGPAFLGFDFIVLDEHAADATALIRRVLHEVNKPLAGLTCSSAGEAADATKVWSLEQIEVALRKDREVPPISSRDYDRAQRGYR